jgi:hypothetical protein
MAKQSSKANTSGLGPRGTGPSRATPYVKVPAGLGGKQNPGGKGSSGKPGSGGGLQSNKYVKAEHVGGSSQTRQVPPTAAAHIGRQVGDHSMDGSGKPMQRNDPSLYSPTRDFGNHGNEVAKNVGRGGPGTGRTVHAKGSQAYYGNPENHPGTINADRSISPPGSNQGSSVPTRPMGSPQGGGGPGGFGFKVGGR